MFVKSHFRTCDVRAEVRAERYFQLCVRSACVLLVFDVRCAIALLHTFLKKNARFSVLEHPFSNLEHPFSVLEHPFSVLEHPFSNLDHPFLFSNILFLCLNILSCFRTAYSDLEHTKIC